MKETRTNKMKHNENEDNHKMGIIKQYYFDETKQKVSNDFVVNVSCINYKPCSKWFKLI